MTALVDIPAVADPRKTLTPSQRALLRKLDRLGPAFKCKGGWMLGGSHHRAATFAPLATHQLTNETFRDGKHRLTVNYAGRCVVMLLERDDPTPSHRFGD